MNHRPLGLCRILLWMGVLVLVTQAASETHSSALFASSPPAEYFVPTNHFPSNGKYMSPLGEMFSWGGLQGRNAVLRNITPFTASPPARGDFQTYNFTGTFDFQFSLNPMTPWIYVHSLAIGVCRLQHIMDAGTTSYFDTEMLQLDLSGGGLPGGIMIRESPTLASTGSHTIRAVSGGFMIDSFFDVFTELSMDGGQTWTPSGNSIALAQTYPAECYTPSNTFPPNRKYASGGGDILDFGGGILIRDMVIGNFSPMSSLPSPGNHQIFSFADSTDLQLSVNGGAIWSAASGSSADAANVISNAEIGAARFFDTEMLSLNISGGSLPGIMIRESPTLTSTGRFNSRSTAKGFMISSFFDIFTEVSVDGGQNWFAAKNYVTMQLICPVFLPMILR